MRLFGLDGAADEDPSSPTGLVSPGLIGLPSATAADILLGPASANLQGVGGEGESLTYRHCAGMMRSVAGIAAAVERTRPGVEIPAAAR